MSAINIISGVKWFFSKKLPISIGIKRKIKVLIFKLFPLLKSNFSTQITVDFGRNSKLLKNISPMSQDGLEIGALNRPIVKKMESNGRIQYVDFSTAEKSREKYKNDPNVTIDDIVEVDYLWGTQTLPELVSGKYFDYVIASHVIEHVPNMLGWMREIAMILKGEGVLSLAIPDKRYTFDVKRDLTSIGTLVESYLLDKRRPGPRDIFDQISLATKLDATRAWTENIDVETLEHHGTLQAAFDAARDNLIMNDYMDVHVNIFTPASFIEILEKASQIGLFDFVVIDFYDTAKGSHEFLVSLKRISTEDDPEKSLSVQSKSFSWARARIN